LICIFGERRKARGRLYSQDYVELLEYQQAQLTAGVHMLYDRIQHGSDCAELRVDPDQGHGGHSTHAILGALGLLDHMPAADESPAPSEDVASHHHSTPDPACGESLHETDAAADAALVPNIKHKKANRPEATAPIMDQRNEAPSFASSTNTPLLEIGQMHTQRYIPVPNTVTWDTGGSERPPWKCGNMAYEGHFKAREAWTLLPESNNFTVVPAEEALMFAFDPGFTTVLSDSLM